VRAATGRTRDGESFPAFGRCELLDVGNDVGNRSARLAR
jgi:hypothetical protein